MTSSVRSSASCSAAGISRSASGRSTPSSPTRLTNGAAEEFSEAGVTAASLHTFEVPGAYELPLAAKYCAESGRFARRRLPRRP